MTEQPAAVVVAGPVSWNHLITLDHLPAPVPHMQFVSRSVHTVGGTSAGKAVHLAALGVGVELHALIGRDDDGDRIERVMRGCAVTMRRHASTATERHVNLMTASGERVSLYVSTPSPPQEESLRRIAERLRQAEVAVIDLSDLGASLLARRDGPQGWGSTPVWTDLHDWDGESAFHAPFLGAAEVVFMNDDSTDDAWDLMRECLARGPRVAVCTLGSRGAIAMDAAGRRAVVEARPATVVDTNGAGDAFFAGYLRAARNGADMADSLASGAAQAVVALASDHLHPALRAGAP